MTRQIRTVTQPSEVRYQAPVQSQHIKNPGFPWETSCPVAEGGKSLLPRKFKSHTKQGSGAPTFVLTHHGQLILGKLEAG